MRLPSIGKSGEGCDAENVDAILDVPVSSVALAVQEVARQR
jgi:hypothetical protein